MTLETMIPKQSKVMLRHISNTNYLEEDTFNQEAKLKYENNLLACPPDTPRLQFHSHSGHIQESTYECVNR